MCICATRDELENVREAWRSIDGFIESGVESESSAISELGSLYHFCRPSSLSGFVLGRRPRRPTALGEVASEHDLLFDASGRGGLGVGGVLTR